ncbi:hypothetical protein SALBM311S_12883 [Streptomyces alboniger]
MSGSRAISSRSAALTVSTLYAVRMRSSLPQNSRGRRRTQHALLGVNPFV